MAGRESSGRERLVALAAIVILAVVVALLSSYALRSPTIADAGGIPGPIPTWAEGTPSLSSSAPPKPGDLSADPVLGDRHIAMRDTMTGMRFSEGVCGGDLPRMETTSDGGSTWNFVSFGGVDVRHIASGSYEDDDRIELVVGIADECRTSVAATYTDGQFWEEYPDRLAQKTYLTADRKSIVRNGESTAAPCSEVSAVEQVESDLYAGCTSGLYSLNLNGGWHSVDQQAINSLGTDAAGASVWATIHSADCDGVAIEKIVDGPALSSVSCRPQLGNWQAVASSDASIWYWSDAGLDVSVDGGASWSLISR